MPETTEHIDYKQIEECRSCGSKELELIMDFGKIPLADVLLDESELSNPEPKVPLSLAFCKQCTLLQIRELVPPEILFGRDYPYYSSVSPKLMAHFQESAENLMKELNLSDDALVVEAASNDGYMLQHFQNEGIPVLGIDPAEGPAKVAIEKGIPTLNTFFGIELARKLKAEGKAADLFLGNNVLAHVPDLNGFLSGIHEILKDDGIAVLEFPYMVQTLDHVEFDQIFHQHFSYLSMHAVKFAAEANGLFLNRVIPTWIHGGSARVFLSKQNNPEASILSFLEEEVQKGIKAVKYYHDFAESVEALKQELKTVISKIKAEGKSIVGYGAAGKANTLLSYFEIGKESLDYIADLSPHKQGKYFPGNHLLIRSPQYVSENPPDYILILAWNFAEEIMEHMDKFKQNGGKFIVPIPEVRIA